MASRYYNPGLAQKVGAASAEQYVSIAPAVERGQIAYQREEAKQLKKKELEFEKRKLEAEAFKKALENRQNLAAKTLDKVQKADWAIDTMPIQTKSLLTLMMKDVKNRTKALNDGILRGDIGEAGAVMMRASIDEDVKRGNDIANAMPKILKNYLDAEPSMINSAEDIEISNQIIGGKFELGFSPTEKDEEGRSKLIAKVKVNDKNFEIPFDEIANPTYIPVDTEAFTAAFTTVNAAADKAASKGKSLDSFNKDIDAVVSNLNFTPEQALSIAFDYLGKERPEYVTIADFKDKNGNIDIAKFKTKMIGDLDGDGEVGDRDDLNLWVKSQLKKAATESYEDYRQDYADKFDTETEAEKRRQRNKDIADQTITSIISDPIKAIEKSGMPDKTEVKNNKITFYNLDKDNNKIINGQFDLKTKEGIAALAKYIASYDYKNDVDLIYNINNYPLTDEQLNQIQKAFLPSLLPRY